MSGLPGRGKPMAKASANVGLVTAVEVNGPMANPPAGKLFSKDSASTWAFAWFIVCVVMLFVVL